MRIANKYSILLLSLFATSIGADSVWADPVVTSPAAPMPTSAATGNSVPPVAMPASNNGKSSAVPSSKAASSMMDESSPEIKIPDLSKPLPGGKKDGKGDLADNKIPSSVKEVIKQLSNKTDDVTLDDLNAAREAVAKLDALIDIEKRLSDLDKIRSDRAKENDKQLAEAIPKSALAPPPAYTPPPLPPPSERKERVSEPMPTVAALPPKPVLADLDIIRIEGSNSRYGALIRDASGVRLVHAGDHLTDGSIVLSVSTQGVDVEKDKMTHMSSIKDVQAVFGDSP